MVTQFLRLKLTLLANTFRRRPSQFVGLVLVVAYALGLALVVAVGLVTLRSTSPDIARAVVIAFGAVAMLGFTVLPLVFGADDPLDPRRFMLFAIPTTRLALLLTVAGVVSVPTVVIALFALAQMVTWSDSAFGVVLGVVAAVLLVPTAVLSVRVSSAIASFYLSARRVREVTSLILIALLAALAPFVAIIATLDWGSAGLPIIRRIAAIATWTPWGAAWSIPADAASGRSEAWIKLVIAIAFLAVLWFAWRALVSMMVVTPKREASQRRYVGLGWFDALPSTPGGVIAARSLSYWSRDSRYQIAVAVVPIVPVVMVVALLIGGVPAAIVAWIPVPVMCLFLGWIIHNDVAHDSSAFWAHVSTSTSGAADRWGRSVPVLLIGIPVAIIGSVITAAVTGDWATVPGLLGLSLGVLLVGLGISSVTSAAHPYPAVLPGDSPFAQPQATTSDGSVVQAMSFFGTVLSAVPAIYLAYLGETESSTWYFAALAYGLVVGGLAFAGGIAWGGRIVRKRGPELLAFTLQN